MKIFAIFSFIFFFVSHIIKLRRKALILNENDSLRSPEFLTFFLSRFVSRIGDGIHSLTILWISYRWSKSALIVALVMISFSLPAILVSPFAGSLADRINRVKIMVLTDIIQGFCTIILAILAYYGKLNLFSLMFFSAIMSVSYAYFMPASMAIIPQIVTKENLVKANGFIQMTSSFSVVIGPIIGVGLIASIGIPMAFLGNSLSFFLSAVFLARIKAKQMEITAKKLSFFNTIKDGFKTIKEYPIASKLLDKTAIINFFFAAITIVIPIFAGKIYQMDSKGIGFMMSSYGAGMFVSSIIFGTKKFKAKPKNLIVFSIIGVGLMFILFGEVHNFYISLFSLFSIGFLLNVANINILALYQSKLPENVLGRVMSFLSAISFSLTPLSYAITGISIDLLGVSTVLLISGLLIMVNGFRINGIKALREA